MGRARRGGAVLAAVCALVVGVTVWNAGLERDRAARDPYRYVDVQLAQSLEARRAYLHEAIGEVRAVDPGTTGLEALDDLADATDQRFRFRGMQGDGTTLAEVTTVGTYSRAFLKNHEAWWTSVCLAVAIEPGHGDGRGSVTTEQIPCAPDAPPPPTDPSSEGGVQVGELRPATVELDRLRTHVPAPTTPPALPPVCYSGSVCDAPGG